MRQGRQNLNQGWNVRRYSANQQWSGGKGKSGEREKDETVVETRVKKVAIRWQAAGTTLHAARRLEFIQVPFALGISGM